MVSAGVALSSMPMAASEQQAYSTVSGIRTLRTENGATDLWHVGGYGL